MNPNGPYVSLAGICDAVLIEKDNKISCIRFLDILNVQAAQEKPETPAAVRIRVTAIIAFKSGPFVGTKNCMLRLVAPSGKTGKLAEASPTSYPMTFNGEEHGYNLTLTLDLPVSESGLYWFDVLLDEEVFTRIPLRVNITWQTEPHDGSESSPSAAEQS